VDAYSPKQTFTYTTTVSFVTRLTGLYEQAADINTALKGFISASENETGEAIISQTF
jgi:hypothetical protein